MVGTPARTRRATSDLAIARPTRYYDAGPPAWLGSKVGLGAHGKATGVGMYEKIKQEVGQDYYIQNFPNDGQRFVAWYLRNIHLRDMIEAKEDVTDGPDDKQIDAIVVDDGNNTVYIIQGKLIGQGSVDAEPLREVLASWIQLKDLARLQETGNQKLKRRLSEVAMALDDEYRESRTQFIRTAETSSSSTMALRPFAANSNRRKGAA